MKTIEKQKQEIKKGYEEMAKRFEEHATHAREIIALIEDMTDAEVQKVYNTLQLMQLSKRFLKKGINITNKMKKNNGKIERDLEDILREILQSLSM